MRRLGDWMTLGWNDVVLRYRRTTLGALWEPFQVLLWAVTLSALFDTALSGNRANYAAYVCLGVIVWGVITDTIVGGARLYVDGANMVKNVSMPLTGLVFRHVSAVGVRLLYQMAAFVIVFLLFRQSPSLSMLLWPISVIVIGINCLWVSLLLGILGVRFRDLSHLLQPLMRFLFFASPVFWVPEPGTVRQQAAEINPAYWFIEMFRAPLLGALPSAWHLTGVALLTVAGLSVTYWIARHQLRSVPLWL